jgi:hypothetical protein
MLGLGPRFLALTETLDLDIVPARFAVRSSALFRAGLELPLPHLGLFAASLPVRLGLIPSIAVPSRPFRWLTGLLERFGTERGGMTVEAIGLADGRITQPGASAWVDIIPWRRSRRNSVTIASAR